MQVLKQDEKSVRRRLQRQLTAKDKKLAEAHAQIASLQQLHIASQAETDKLRIQLNQLKDAAVDTANAGVHITNAQQTDASVDKARIVELQQQLQVATEEAGEQQSRAAAISQQMQQDMQVLRQDLQLAKDESQLQQEKAAAMYQELQQHMQGQIAKLQLDNYHLKLQGRL